MTADAGSSLVLGPPEDGSETRAGRSAPTRTRRRRVRLRRRITVLCFLSPWIIGFLAFIFYPMVSSLYFSFTKYDLLSQPTWVGLDNYRFMFTSDDIFWIAFRNTLWIVAILVPAQILFGMATAWVLVRPRTGSGVYRTLFYLPAMVPTVAAALGFLFVLSPSGPVNHGLELLGVSKGSVPLWFIDPSLTKPSLVLLSLWAIGNTMVIFLAAMLDVPTQLYEAAAIEGAGEWAKFRHITLPIVSPVIFFSTVIGVIYGFQFFTEAYVVSTATSAGEQASTSLGSPDNSLMFYGTWLYQQGFGYFHMGYASAMAWVLFVVIMLCTFVLIKSSSRWVHYGGALR
jgi:multiple sugar transport system permease protein